MRFVIKKLFIALFVISPIVLSAQNRSYGQLAVRAAGGITLPVNWGANIGIEKHLGLTRSFITVDLLLLNKQKEIFSDKLNILRSNLNIQYNYSILNMNRINLSTGIGISAGLTNYSSKHKYIQITSPTQVGVAPVANLSIDYSFSDKLSLYISPQVIYDVIMKTENYSLESGDRLQFYILFGLKFNL